MTTCPSCGAAEDKRQDSRRTYYVCGSYSHDGATARQSDLCFANQRIRNVRAIATTDGESAAQLLDRVKEMLAL